MAALVVVWYVPEDPSDSVELEPPCDPNCGIPVQVGAALVFVPVLGITVIGHGAGRLARQQRRPSAARSANPSPRNG